jgi:hypothetical protein
MYKKIFISTTAVICIFISVSTAIISTDRDNDTNNIRGQHKIATEEKTATADSDFEQHSEETTYADIKGYKIQTGENKLNIYQVYSNGYSELIQSADINPSVLPYEDRRLLEEGINTVTYDEVCSLMEDFSS